MSKRLKVSTLYRAGGTRHRPRWSKVPQLRLSGHWLQRAGFATGARVNVQLINGALVITPHD